MLISKEGSFDAAHRLLDYQGLCSNIHGHRWRVRVTWSSEVLDSQGMTVDFKLLSFILKSGLELFDHKILLNKEDPLVGILLGTKEIFSGQDFLWLCDGNPTAENLATSILKFLVEAQKSQFIPHILSSVKVHSVQLWETETSFVLVTNE